MVALGHGVLLPLGGGGEFVVVGGELERFVPPVLLGGFPDLFGGPRRSTAGKGQGQTGDGVGGNAQVEDL